MKTKLFLILCLAIGVFSCKNEDLVTPEVAGEEIQSTNEIIAEEETDYFLDGNKITEAEYEDLGEELDVIIFQGLPDNPSDNNFHFHAFSDKSDYYAFAQKHELAVAKIEAFENEIAVLNTEYDVDNIDLKDDKTIANYTAEAQLIYESHFSTESEKLFTFIYKNCSSMNGASGGWPSVTGAMPVMPPGFNNTVSVHDHLGVYGYVIIYDRAFFRRSLGFVFSFGLGGTACYPANLDNRMSSMMAFSI